MELQSTTTTVTTISDPPTTAAPSQSLLLIRNLASCNTSTRSKSLRELTNWLPTQAQITDDEMKKLWKGLFYCIWHSDKAPVQSNLINKLSSMLLTLDIPLSLHYLSVFFTTLRREWSGIDVHRLDKFYILIRRFVNCSFQLMKKNDWNSELCNCVMSVYETKSLLANEKKFLGNGVNYHIVSVFLDEVKSYLPVSEEVYRILFNPFLNVMSVCQDKVLIGKIRSTVFERLLCMGKNLLEKRKNGDDEIEDEVVNLGTIALKMRFAGVFYDLGSSNDCFQGNRKGLFGLNKDFTKLEKELEVSGIEVLFPDVRADNGDEEVPDFVPIVADETKKQNDGSVLLLGSSGSGEAGAKKSSKKKKKKKVAKDGSDSQDIETMKENDDINVNVANGESLSNGITSNGNEVTFTELFKFNLQKEFEKVADEDNLDKDGESSLQNLSSLTITKTKVPKKRKRLRSTDARESNNTDLTEQVRTDIKSGEKSAKKVRFSIKNNLVWKPQTPLPPQSLRIPPSVTPRGSALKQGVPPGPVREMRPAAKRVKKKKVRKVMKTTSPAVKRLRKL